MGEKRNTAYRGFVGKNEDDRPSGKHGHRWKNNITVELKETARILLAERRDQ